MNVPRETFYAALFAHLQAAVGAQFVTLSRKWRMPNTIAPEARPALFQVQTGEKAKTDPTGKPIIWTASVDLVIYTTGSGDDSNAIPSQELNALVDAVETALAATTPGTRQTLGGVVYAVNLFKDKVRMIENVSGNMAMAIFPVEIIANA